MTGLIERIMPGVPTGAAWLGLAGLIPFAGLAGVALLSGDARVVALLESYGAIILSFMGGCRWGLAAANLGEGPSARALGLSVIPALYAWAALAVPGTTVLLAFGFAGLLAADLALARAGGAPAWWPALRWPLSIGATAAMLAGAAT